MFGSSINIKCSHLHFFRSKSSICKRSCLSCAKSAFLRWRG